MDDYLSKPIAREHLGAALQQWGARVMVVKQEEKPMAQINGVINQDYLRETFGDDPEFIQELLGWVPARVLARDSPGVPG